MKIGVSPAWHTTCTVNSASSNICRSVAYGSTVPSRISSGTARSILVIDGTKIEPDPTLMYHLDGRVAELNGPSAEEAARVAGLRRGDPRLGGVVDHALVAKLKLPTERLGKASGFSLRSDYRSVKSGNKGSCVN